MVSAFDTVIVRLRTANYSSERLKILLSLLSIHGILVENSGEQSTPDGLEERIHSCC